MSKGHTVGFTAALVAVGIADSLCCCDGETALSESEKKFDYARMTDTRTANYENTSQGMVYDLYLPSDITVD